MKKFITIILTLISGILLGQNKFTINDSIKNLLVNPGFETLIDNSTQINKTKLKCKDWYSLCNLSTPDCITNKIDDNITKNKFGYIVPHSGNSCIGFIPFSWDGYFETITGKFSYPLEKGKKYEISFYIRYIGDSCFFKLKRMEAILSNSNLLTNRSNLPFYDSYHINTEKKIKADIIFKLDKNINCCWHFINKTYKAKGGEKYISFGIFYHKKLFNNLGKYERICSSKDTLILNPLYIDKKKFFIKNNKMMYLNPLTKDKNISSVFTYYLIDDVRVKKIN